MSEAEPLDSYRLVNGAVVDLRQLSAEARSFIGDVALRLAQGQGHDELVGRVLRADAPIYGRTSPVSPAAAELPGVQVARDLVYRAGVAEGVIEPLPIEADLELLPRGLRTSRDAAGVLRPVERTGKPLTSEDIVTVGEAMHLLGITRQAVINTVRVGKVRGEQHGKVWVLSREDVLRYRAFRSGRDGRKGGRS